MLWGSVFIGFFAYYLNSYYSGKFLNYSMIEQLRDILPSFGVAALMAILTYMVSLLPFSPYLLLPLQLLVGAVMTFLLCECFRLEEYKELKEIASSALCKMSLK